MSFRARTFKINYRCYIDSEVYNGFNIAICVYGKTPIDNPIQQLYIKPVYNPSGWYEYTFYDFFLDDLKTYDVFVQAIAYGTDSYWRSVGGIEIPDDGIGTIGDQPSSTPPSIVSGFTYQVIETGVLLSWNPSYNYQLSHYSIKLGSTWETGIPVHTGKNTSHLMPMLVSGNYTFHIKAVNTSELESLSSSSVSFTVIKPSAPSVFASLVGDSMQLEWNVPTSTFPIVEYELKQNSVSLGKIKSTVYTIKAPVADTYVFTVTAINAVGEVGNPGSASITITAPGAVVVYPQIIDNNVLLKWSAPTVGSLPISHYEIRKGAVFSSAVPIGTINSLFSVVFESVAGDYTYWVRAVDTAGNSGIESYCIAAVSQPPDFVLHGDYNSEFDGVKTNLLSETDILMGPVDTTESWATHFTKQSITTPQQQINAGFPHYIQPTLSSGSYVEVLDYQAIVNSSKINITIESRIILGTVSLSTQLETSVNGIDWTNHGSVFETYAKGFRYVKLTLTFSTLSNGENIVAVDNINIKLSLKKKSDGGIKVCSSSDVGGTEVLFNETFLDITAIGVTPKYDGTVAYGLYDFVDAPYPTSFKILLYDKNGNRVSGTASWEARGV
jgi:hypothetical protein